MIRNTHVSHTWLKPPKKRYLLFRNHGFDNGVHFSAVYFKGYDLGLDTQLFFWPLRQAENMLRC